MNMLDENIDSDEVIDRLCAMLEQLRAENKRYREALQFYAKKETWLPSGKDYGRKARVALFNLDPPQLSSADRAG